MEICPKFFTLSVLLLLPQPFGGVNAIKSQFTMSDNGMVELMEQKIASTITKICAGAGSHVNTCESFFFLLKRGIYGSFHHVSKEHLPRYCDEFSFRWNNRHLNSEEKFVTGLKQSGGKRLIYKKPIE